MTVSAVTMDIAVNIVVAEFSSEGAPEDVCAGHVLPGRPFADDSR